MKKHKVDLTEFTDFKIQNIEANKEMKIPILKDFQHSQANTLGEATIHSLNNKEIELSLNFFDEVRQLEFEKALERDTVEISPAICIFEKEGNWITKCELMAVSICPKFRN